MRDEPQPGAADPSDFVRSFGSEPLHDPARESIAAVTQTATEARVRTRHIDAYDFASDYEYDLLRLDGRWYIEQVYYVADGQRYPTP